MRVVATKMYVKEISEYVKFWDRPFAFDAYACQWCGCGRDAQLAFTCVHADSLHLCNG
jgi:hypothetical protein